MTLIGAVISFRAGAVNESEFLRPVAAAAGDCHPGLYFLLTPSIGAADQKQRPECRLPSGCTAGIGIGFYDGVFGRARVLSMHWRM